MAVQIAAFRGCEDEEGLLLRKGVGQWNSRALEFSHCWGLHLGNVGLGQRMQDKITEPSHEEIYPKIQFKPPWPFLVTWGRD